MYQYFFKENHIIYHNVNTPIYSKNWIPLLILSFLLCLVGAECLPFTRTRVHHRFLVGSVLLILIVFCVVFFVLFVLILCLVSHVSCVSCVLCLLCLVSPVSCVPNVASVSDYPFLITPSVFSNVYINSSY